MLVHPLLRWSSVYLVVFSPAAMFTAQRRNLFSLLISSSPEEEEVIVVVATIAPSSSNIRVASFSSFGHLSLDTMKYAVNFLIVLTHRQRFPKNVQYFVPKKRLGEVGKLFRKFIRFGESSLYSVNTKFPN